MAFLNKTPKLISDIKEAALARVKVFYDRLGVPPETPLEFKPKALLDGSTISSSLYNSEMVALIEELRALYYQTGVIDTTASKHSAIVMESFRKTRAGILHAINDMRLFTDLRQNPEYDDMSYVDFYVARNDITKSPLALVDTDTRILRLGHESRIPVEVIRTTNGKAKIDITHVGGGRSGSLIQDFEPERMLDASDQTFWADLILTDGPIFQTYNTSGGTSRSSHGLVTEIKVTLSEVSQINSLRVLPFAEHPVVLIDAAYKSSEGQDYWTEIPDFFEGDAGLDWIELFFTPIKASVIRLTFLQENYVHGIYHLPEKMVHSTNILEHVVADTYLTRVGYGGLSDAEVGRVTATPSLLGYVEALREFEAGIQSEGMPQERIREVELTQHVLKKMVEVLSRPNPAEAIDLLEPSGIHPEEVQEKLLEVSTTEYLIGVRTLQVLNTTYLPVSYYASPPFDPGGTPVEISMITDEDHSELEDEFSSYRQTSVEYEVDLGDGLRYPILPTNSTNDASELVVYDEVVFVDRSTNIGLTRFEPLSVGVSVRKDGVILPSTAYTFEIEAGKGKLSILSGYVHTAVYSVTYSVVTTSTLIDLPSNINSTRIRIPEEFDGTDENAHISLKYIPYTEYDIINDEDSFNRREDEGIWDYIVQGGGTTTTDGITYGIDNSSYEPIVVLVNNIKARNITNYLTGEQPAFTASDPTSRVYEYFHLGREMYFNAPVDSMITVQYNWLVQHVQVIATLRCFKTAGVNLTPRVNNFTLRYRTTSL